MTESLTAGERQIDLSSPVCMGIINVTPDSFSDGSYLQKVGTNKFQVDLDKALALAESMVCDGAVILDVGGESTRPRAEPVSIQEEIDRVIPVIEKIHRQLDVCISVDTSSPKLMQAAISNGAGFVNDIRALTTAGAVEVVAGSKVAVCLMHMQGEPSTMQKTISYNNLAEEVFSFLKERVRVCAEQGIEQQRLVVDPGFGFGKSVEHNYHILRNLANFSALELPLLVGVSRKSMIGEVINRPVDQRLAGSIAATSYALMAGAKIIRTHDVAATMDAIRVNSAYINGEKL